MPAAASASAKTKRAAPRKAGRPPAAEGNRVDAEAIIAAALKLARRVPLQDLSIVIVARELGVTPALLHYYLGGRDSLTSGVMNAFYKELLDIWPAPADDTETTLLRVVRAMYDHFTRYAGVAAYTLSNNKFRIFQIVPKGQTDFGVEILERFTEAVAAYRCSPERTGIYAHMLLDFVISSAHHRVTHRYPGEHRDFLTARTDQLDLSSYPAIAFTRESLVNLDAEAAFEEGCKLYLIGLHNERKLPPAKAVVKPAVRPLD